MGDGLPAPNTPYKKQNDSKVSAGDNQCKPCDKANAFHLETS